MITPTQPVSQPQAKPTVSALVPTTPKVLPVGLTYILETPAHTDFGVVLRVMLAE